MKKKRKLLRYAFVMNCCFIPGNEKWRDETSTSSQMKWILHASGEAGCVYRIHFCAVPRRVARDVLKWRTLDGESFANVTRTV